MFASQRPRPLIWLALFAWLAQLCLPIAHAQFVGSRDCGLRADRALQAKLAALPAELRHIIAPDLERADSHSGCAQLCASLPANGSAHTSAALAWAATVEPPPARAASRISSLDPPAAFARGPPAFS